jgi:hypothetical protein
VQRCADKSCFERKEREKGQRQGKEKEKVR